MGRIFVRKYVSLDLNKSLQKNSKLAELKAEVISILRKKEESEIKKAIEYIESLESKYSYLEKSVTGEWIEKAGYGVGTVRIWKGKKYKKVSANPTRWVRVYNKEDRGAKASMTRLINKVNSCNSEEELYQFCLQNHAIFKDENGVDLPIMDRLREAIDNKKNGTSNSKTVENQNKKEAGNNQKAGINEDGVYVATAKDGRRIEVEESDENGFQYTIYDKDGKELDGGYAYDDDSDEDEISRFGNMSLEEASKEFMKMQGFDTEEAGNNQTTEAPDYTKMSNSELDKINEESFEKFKKTGDEEALEVHKKVRKQMDINEAKLPYKRAMKGESKEENLKYLDERISSKEKDIKKLETSLKKTKDVKKNWQKHNLLINYRNDLEALKQLKVEVQESEAEKHENRSNAMLGNQNAYKGGSKEESEDLNTKIENYLKEENQKKDKELNISDSEINSLTDIDYLKDLQKKVVKENNRLNSEKKYDEANDMARRNYVISDRIKQLEKEDKQRQDAKEKVKENVKEKLQQRDNQNVSTNPMAPSTISDANNLQPIATNKWNGEGEVKMPYSKELNSAIKSLQNSTDKNAPGPREFLSKIYYKDGNLVATDGRRLKIVKVGALDGIENESFVEIENTKDGVKITKMENKHNMQFPNYSRVVPNNNNQHITLDSKALKKKIKDLKEEGAISKNRNNPNSMMISLEIENGNLMLDGVKVGSADGVEFDNGKPYFNMNAEYLENALTGDTATLMASTNSDKAMLISTNSSMDILMPLQTTSREWDSNGNMHEKENKADYNQGREYLKNKRDEDSKVKEYRVKQMDDFIDNAMKQFTPEKVAKLINTINDKGTQNHESIIKRTYEDMKKAEKMYNKPTNNWEEELYTANRYGFNTFAIAKNYPDFKEALENMANEYGFVKKSLFDVIDFDEIIESDDEEFNDYSAIQPELFNSTSYKVGCALDSVFGC